MKRSKPDRWKGLLAAMSAFVCVFQLQPFLHAQQPERSLELSRAARPWEFVSAVGRHSGLLGNEGGQLEAWVYPLKILQNFHLRFKLDGEVIDGKSLARSVSVRPESTTITYVWDTFSVRETLLAPVHEPGLIIALDVDAAKPLDIEAVFERDLELEWPGAMGPSDIDWVPALHAFALGDDQHKFTALVGSLSAFHLQDEDETNYTSTRTNAFGFTISPGKSTKVIAIAGSFAGLPSAEVTYRKLSTNYPQLLSGSGAYYANYLKDHISLELPDQSIEQAYEWAQVSLLQGVVDNPFLGTGLIAGYKRSGNDARPGFAWFFGRDALWSALALDAEGDFETTRSALDFLSKYQKSDGKVPHEISQSASFVPWFQSMPYAYASADATPLFIVAMQNYVQRSGDLAFAEEKWDNLWRAYQFMVATYDANGIPRNEGVGHGWVEGGPLFPVKSEFYQASVVLEAVHSLELLAHAAGKDDLMASLHKEFEQGRVRLNTTFWMPEKNQFAYGLDARGAKLDSQTVLSAVPMWFGLLDEPKAHAMLDILQQPEIQTDWGMRIIPTTSPKYDASGYHAGTVWPLFTGWASVGEYRYHHALAGYENLRANALLTFDGSLGNVTEVLSGNYYQTLATGSPHQIWSSAMVISPLLTGLLGLDTDASLQQIILRPHVPADWTSFAIHNVNAGKCRVNIRYRKIIDKMTFEIERVAGTSCPVELSPALSLRAQVIGVELNGHGLSYHVQENDQDQHVTVHLHVTDRPAVVEFRLKNDFGLSEEVPLPSLGSASNGLRIVREQWSEGRDTLTLDAASTTAGTYELGVWNVAQVVSVDGAELVRPETHGDAHAEQHGAKLRITTIAGSAVGDAHEQVTLHFIGGARPKRLADTTEPGLKGEQIDP